MATVSVTLKIDVLDLAEANIEFNKIKNFITNNIKYSLDGGIRYIE